MTYAALCPGNGARERSEPIQSVSGSAALAGSYGMQALIDYANGEQRYKPWGEKRYPTGASGLPTT
jgi:hypothetical protein